MFNEKTYYADVTDLLQFTITVRKSRRQNQYTLHFVCEDGELFVSVDLHVYIYIYIYMLAAASKTRVNNSYRQSTFLF